MSKYIYIIYKTTNIINNMFYIGAHKQDLCFPVLFDGYLGSGSYLKRAIKKFGRENFIRETLFIYYTPEEAFVKEAEIVDVTFIKRKDTYNIQLGGSGDMVFNDIKRMRISKAMKGKTSSFKGHKHTKETKQLLSNINKTKVGELNNFFGHKHTEETKQTISKKAKERFSDETFRIKFQNSMKNRILIFSDEYRRKLSEKSKRMWREHPERMFSLTKWQEENGGAFTGHKHTEESKRKMSLKLSGKKNPVYGKTHTEEARKKISEKRKGNPIGKSEFVTCPHCGKQGFARGIKGKHFDKCKFKQNK